MISKFIKGRVFIPILLLAVVFYSCTDNNDLDNIIVTEDVLYISGDVVMLTGRVIEVNGTIDDHGFQIDDTEDFSSPIVVSLGEKIDGLGRYIGEYDALSINTGYYYRSYMNVGGEETTGQIKEFSSLKPSLDSFYPHDGVEGNSLLIYGTNFTQDTKVSIGEKNAEIQSIENESTIVVKIPSLGNSFSVPVTVIVQDTSMTFRKSFQYHYGRWKLESTFFDNTQIYDAMWLKNGDEFIFGLGAPDRFSINNKIWRLDLTDYSWSELNFPGADSSPARLPFHAGQVWGSGDTNFEFGRFELSSYFWKYDNGTFELRTFLPFMLAGSVAYYLNGELYVFGGQLWNYDYNNYILKYDEVNDSWSLVHSSPIEISYDYPSFAYNSEAYFLQPDGNIWKFSPADNTWSVVTYFNETIEGGGVAVVLDDKVYLGLFESGRQIWEWDITNDVWTQKSSFTGSGIRDENVAYFAHNNKLFFFRAKYDGGAFEQDPRMELWSLDPNELK